MADDCKSCHAVCGAECPKCKGHVVSQVPPAPLPRSREWLFHSQTRQHLFEQLRVNAQPASLPFYVFQFIKSSKQP